MKYQIGRRWTFNAELAMLDRRVRGRAEMGGGGASSHSPQVIHRARSCKAGDAIKLRRKKMQKRRPIHKQ